MKDLRSLTPHQGAMRRFLCDSCPDDAVLYTNSSNLELDVNWLTANDTLDTLPRDIQIFVDDIPLGARRDFTTSRRVIINLELTGGRRPMRSVRVRQAEWNLLLHIVSDFAPPTVWIEVEDEHEREDAFDYSFRVTFSKNVVWDPEPGNCQSMQRLDSRRVTTE